ncbi:hypothetical protein V3H18_06325 [Methylocystis sp. 9N]|uniref:Lipoprotein n=1 Tax=Methylocystis borbori TaxID=3118750 RepID=A0ABU7XFI8_9HYPH
MKLSLYSLVACGALLSLGACNTTQQQTAAADPHAGHDAATHARLTRRPPPGLPPEGAGGQGAGEISSPGGGGHHH